VARCGPKKRLQHCSFFPIGFTGLGGASNIDGRKGPPLRVETSIRAA
jgi:hypothetical protein